MKYQEVKGEQVPALGLGTWRLSGETCAKAVERALSMGYRHLDTAQSYGNEEEVGKGIEKSGVERPEVFLVTKISPNDFARDRALAAGRERVKKLGTEYVDLLLMHWPNPSVPVGETLGAMRELQEEGLVKHVGVSNFSPEQVEQATSHAEVFCNQVEYNPYRSRDALLAQAKEMDYLLTAYTPTARGRVAQDRALQEVAEAHGKSPTQVALRWLTQQEKVAAIPKATGEEHLEENLDIFDFELSDEEMERVFALTR